MKEYVKRVTAPSGRGYAAVYHAGQPLDDVLAVARKADRGATVAEIPDMGVLVVRYLYVPDHSPSRIDYEVVEDGKVLVYSDSYDTLYSTDEHSFETEWQEA